MRNQLAYAEESGAIWKTVDEVMKDGLSNGGLITTSRMVDLLKEKENWASLSKL